jgi:hypothetical protein
MMASALPVYRERTLRGKTLFSLLSMPNRLDLPGLEAGNFDGQDFSRQRYASWSEAAAYPEY